MAAPVKYRERMSIMHTTSLIFSVSILFCNQNNLYSYLKQELFIKKKKLMNKNKNLFVGLANFNWSTLTRANFDHCITRTTYKPCHLYLLSFLPYIENHGFIIFRHRGFYLLFSNGECEELNDSQTVDSHCFPQPFNEAKKKSGLAPAAIVLSRKESNDTLLALQSIDINRRQTTNSPIGKQI